MMAICYADGSVMADDRCGISRSGDTGKTVPYLSDLLINQNVPWVEVVAKGAQVEDAIEAVARMTRRDEAALLAACTYCTNF